MASLRALIKLTRLNPNEILSVSLDNPGVKQQIIDRNQEQMYEQGIDSKSESLGEYSPNTIKIKQEKGQRYDHITLNDTGEFYDSMKVVPQGSGAVISADMQKPDTNLETIYPEALGLTEESKEQVKPILVSVMKREILKAIR